MTNLTPVFIESFVTRCYEHGLSKEAATQMLQNVALVELSNNDEALDALVKRAEELGLTKEAGIGGLVTKGLAGLGALGLVGGGVAAIGHNTADGKYKPKKTDYVGVPSAGGYDPKFEEARQKFELDYKSRDLSTIATAANLEGQNKAKLEAVVAAGGPGAANALQDLKRYKDTPDTKRYNDYGTNLGYAIDHTDRQLAEMNKRVSNVNSAKNSWVTKTRTFLGFPRDIEGEELHLIQNQSRLKNELDINKKLKERWDSGATSFSTAPTAAQEAPRKSYFDTY